MRAIRPQIDAPQLTIAEDQDEFKVITGALVRHPLYPAVRARVAGADDPIELNTVVLAFRPTDEERARIAAGDDLYLSLLTFLKPMQAVILSVGAEETAAIYGAKVEV